MTALAVVLQAAFDVVVHVVRGLDGRRRVAEICVLHRAGLATDQLHALLSGRGESW